MAEIYTLVLSSSLVYQLVGLLVIILLAVLILNWYYRSLKMDKSYSDLYVLITGCDTGFGNRCAQRLDKLGFHVFAACLTTEKAHELSESCSKNLVTIQLDVTDESSVKQALSVVKEHLPEGKGLWAVINNAGIMGTVAPCEWLKKSDYEATLKVNFLGMVSVSTTFLPLVRKARGHIVNTSSVLGRFAAIPASYSVSKFCVEAYSDCLRQEMAPMGVGVHIIEPGGYQTRVTDAKIHTVNLNKSFNELDPDLKAFYGESYKRKVIEMLEWSCYLLSSRNIDEVVDAYIHAITARYPKIRYVVGLNGLLFRALWTLPTCFVDFLIGFAAVKPEGL